MSVIMTMTTCKRLALFTLTIQSLYRHCLDCQNIPLLIVDDGSSMEDQNVMIQLVKNYTTTFQFVAKRPEMKGHDKSMNLIQTMTTSYRYVFHLEDDWEFLVSDHFIRKTIEILESFPRIGQVMINQDYQERLNDTRNIIGSKPSHLGNYRVHIWDPDHTLCKPGELSNGHWPHYSLRPSMIQRSMWTHVGSFTEGHSHFEWEYGIRYMQKGFETAFLPGVYAQHIGKTSWETEEEHPSAYTLNKVKRFI